jgi:hypothetical protein
VEADLVRKAFYMSTELKNVSMDTNKQLIFSIGTGDYISGRADKNGGIPETSLGICCS